MSQNSNNLISLLDIPELPHSLQLTASALFKKACAQTQDSHEPLFVHLCGVPGSGKSSYANAKHAELTNTYLLRFDDIMEGLSGYQKDLEEKGDIEAFALWEIPARILGYHLMFHLIENKRNILFDHSAAFPTHIKLIEDLKRRGFRVEMHRMCCDIGEAKERVRKRNLDHARHTPVRLVDERAKMLEKLIPQYQSLVDVFLEIPDSNPAK